MEQSVNNRVLLSRPRAWRRLRRDESGAALLEFSLVFGLFVFILYGLIAFGMILALKQSVTNAATEAARSAVGITDDTSAISKATTTAQDRLSWLSSSQKAALQVTPTIASCAGGSGRCITVVVTYPYKGHELVPPAPGLGLVTPNSISTTSTVQITS
jgi:Flp pilus assembly protein TadG